MTSSLTLPRYAIVTGGARGLGREFCLALAGHGCHVAIVDVDEAGAGKTLRHVEGDNGTGQIEICDVTDSAAWRSLYDRLQNQWPQLDLLVNNAGMYGAASIGKLDLANAERLIRLNLHSVLYGCNMMVPWLVETAARQTSADWRGSALPKRPHIINVASSFAFLCPPGMAAYNLSKAGVVALSETLYGELRTKGVGVTAACPGPMPTRFVESATFESPAFQRLTQSYVDASTLDPARVAETAIRAMQRRKLYVVMGADQRWYWRLKRWVPETLVRRVARRVQRELKLHA
jgi:short-subunit dehydrogenase